MTDKERMDRIRLRKSVSVPLVIILRAHFYTGIPRTCALRGGPRTPECPGHFALLRSEQGAAPLAPLCGYPCTLGQQKRFCKPFPLTKFSYRESDRQ